MRKRVFEIACCAVVAMMVVQPGHAQVVAPIGDSVDGHIFRILDEPARDPLLVAQRDGGSEPQSAPDSRTSRNRDLDESVDGSNDRLIDRAVDPISWLMQFRLRQDWNWPVGNTGLDSQEFQFRPTIPFKAWDQVNLLRIRIPYMTQGNDAPGLGKVEMEDAVVFTPEWGRWGVGPAWRFDPNSGSGGDFQIGPVVGAVAKTKHWTYGFISQSWLGGSDSETDIQPILAYKFNDEWALTLGEMQFKYDWTDRKWKQVPLGIELNWISDVCGQKIEWFVNPQYNFESTSSNSGWTVYVGLVLLVPGA